MSPRSPKRSSPRARTITGIVATPTASDRTCPSRLRRVLRATSDPREERGPSAPLNRSRPLPRTSSCGGSNRSDGALPADNGRDRLEQDLDVQQQRPVLHVLRIERHDLLERDDVRAAVHLPKPGDPRLRTQAREVM